jgi:hypothetical protein
MKLNGKENYSSAGAFTSCTRRVSLLETFANAAKSAAAGDEILLSPVRSSSERFQNLQQRGEEIYLPAKSISWGCPAASPKIHGDCSGSLNRARNSVVTKNFSRRDLLRENHGANEHINRTSQKGAIARQK